MIWENYNTLWIGLASFVLVLFVLYLVLEVWVGQKRTKYKIANLKKLAGNATNRELALANAGHHYKNLWSVICFKLKMLRIRMKVGYYHIVGVINSIINSYKHRNNKVNKDNEVEPTKFSVGPFDKELVSKITTKLKPLDTKKLREDAMCSEGGYFGEKERKDAGKETCDIPFTVGGRMTEGELKYYNKKEITNNEQDSQQHSPGSTE